MKTINKTKNHSANKHQKSWYKLDLSANVYPTLQRKNFSNVFRLSVVLKEEIDPDTLQKAVDLTLPRFRHSKLPCEKAFSGVIWNPTTGRIQHLEKHSEGQKKQACRCWQWIVR